MVFAHDTTVALTEAAALVNTRSDAGDTLDSPEGLRAYLDRFGFTGPVEGTAEEVAEVRRLRERLRRLWHIPDRDQAATVVNDILAAADARPYLTRHDGWDWHLHLTRPDAPVSMRIGAELAMGFLDLIREDEWDRLRFCAAEDCDDVLVDLSRNRSKRYCDAATCGNRANVAAYRARQRAARR